MRLIDADALIEKCKDIVFTYPDGSKYRHRCVDPSVIREMPTVNPQPHWIPCSERLPELNGSGCSEMVLLCWSDGQVTVGAYAGNRTFCGQAWPKAKDARVIVAAWMPLPEPYRGEQDEHNH